MNFIPIGDIVSFFTRLATYYLLLKITGSYLTAIFIYLFLDLIIMDIVLLETRGLRKLKSGLDSFFKDLAIINCFYVTLDRKVEDVEEIKQFMQENSKGMDRFSCNLVKILGKYYLRQLHGPELQKAWNNCFIVVDDPVTSKEQLATLIRNFGRPQFDEQGLQWNIFLVKDYKVTNTSVLIFKVNHFLCDGIGAVLLATSFQKDPTKSQMPFIREIQPIDQLRYNAAFVTALYYLGKDALSLCTVNNDGINQFQAINEDFLFCESDQYQVSQLKLLCREQGCTINDLIMAVFTSEVAAYAIQMEKEETLDLRQRSKKGSLKLPNEAIINVVINLRDPPKSFDEMRVAGNQLHYQIVKFPLSGDFNQSLMRIKQQLDEFKNSKSLYFLYTFMYFIGALAPKFLNDFILNDVMRKGTKISITNICGPEAPLKFGNAVSQDIMFANYYEENFLQITVFSYQGKLRMGINVGKMGICAKKLMQNVDKKLQSLISSIKTKVQ